MKRFLPILTALFVVTSATTLKASKAESFQDKDKPTIPNETLSKSNNTFGDGVAAYSLGRFEKAKRIWMSLAQAGHGEAAFRLARMMDRTKATDKALVLKYYTQAMMAGYDQAIIPWFKIKNGLQQADNSPKGLTPAALTIAVNKLSQLADNNNGPALVEMGLCLVNETCGVKADYPKALGLFKRALNSDLMSYSKDRVSQYIAMLEKALSSK